ncbi:MAG TPA: hypothetical protein VF261_01370 [Candidatus Saccharimonadales bacterium]
MIRDFAEANRRLAVFYDNARTEYTLDNMLRLMDYLGSPQEKLKVLHIAGTSGKTSTAYYAAALLSAAGHETGLTVSPHVDEINERVQLNMVPLAEDEFCAELSEFLELIDRAPVKPSWFELMVAFVYWYFAKAEVEYAVVEVGLGGLKDGTNVVRRADKVCIITDIGLDHTQILGDTLPKIAAQKAGIIHPGNEVFVYRQADEIMDVFAQTASEQHAHLRIEEFDGPVEGSDLPVFQQRNFHLAEQAVAYILQRDGQPALTDNQSHAAAHTYIPARMEITQLDDKTIVVDGAHNAQKLGVLIDSLHAKYPRTEFAALVAFVESDEQRLGGAITALTSLTDTFIVTSFVTAKDYIKHSVDPAVIAQRLRGKGVSAEVIQDAKAAFEHLLAQPQPVLVITGSFYLLNHIRLLIKERAEGIITAAGAVSK